MRSTLLYTFGPGTEVAQAIARAGDPTESTFTDDRLRVRAGSPGPDVEVLRQQDGVLALVTRDGPQRACTRLAALGLGACSCPDAGAAPPRHVVAGVSLEPDRVGAKPVGTVVGKTFAGGAADVVGRVGRGALLAAALGDALDGHGAGRLRSLLDDPAVIGASSQEAHSPPTDDRRSSHIEVVDLAPCWWDAAPDGLVAVERVSAAVGSAVEMILSSTKSGDIGLACAFDVGRYDLASVEDVLDAAAVLLETWLVGRLADVTPEGPVLVGRSVEPGDLTRVLAHIAARRSAAPALSDADVVWDWTELNERVRSLADELRDHGVTEGVRVGVRAEPTAVYVASLLAAWTSGATAVPYGAGANARDRAIVGSVSAVLEDGRLRLEGPLAADVSPAIAFVAHTSGSTGEPKAVSVARDALATYVTSFAQELSLGPDDHMVGVNAPMFDGFYEQVLAPLAVGARVHLADIYEGVPALVDLLSSTGATVLDLSTALWRVVADYLDELDEPMPAELRAVVIGGEAYESDRAARFLARGAGGVDLVSMYGPVECTISATMVRVGRREADADRPLLGRPMPGAVVAVVDDSGRSAVRGAVGEICIGGYGVSPGVPVIRVWHPRTGDELPMYRTGDLGRVRPDHSLEYFGRRDDEVKIRGYRVAPAEIRRALLAIEGVDDAAVMGLPGRYGVEVGAVVAGAGSLAESDVLARLRSALPDFLVPTKLKVVKSLPVNDVGKTDRVRLLSLLRDAY